MGHHLFQDDSNRDRRMTTIHRFCKYFFLTGAVVLSTCTTRPPFLANADPALRKTNAQFASDAAKRSYPADAPKGGQANGGAEVDYGIHRLSIVNSSSEDWNNVEIWLNKKYVIFI